MVCVPVSLSFGSPGPERLAGFWGGLLGQDVTVDRGAPALSAPPGVGFGLRFVADPADRWGPNQMHPDLRPDSVREQAATVRRALGLGARHLDVGQGPDAEHVVLADPDGNELCVLEPGGRFLAGCPFFSSLAGDGLAQVGHFWRDALAWALVWDQDGETAVQAPTGGPKLTWGGEPVAPKRGRNRLHLDLAPSAGTTVGAEVERLLALGATRADAGCADGVGLADPGGNELCVVGPPSSPVPATDAVTCHRLDAASEEIAALAGLFERYRTHHGQAPAPAAAREWVDQAARSGELELYGAYRGRQLVGFATVHQAPASLRLARSWQLRDLYVDPAARRRGVALGLVETVRRAAREAGALRLSLHTEPDNAAALALYRRCGFEIEAGLVTLSLDVNG